MLISRIGKLYVARTIVAFILIATGFHSKGQPFIPESDFISQLNLNGSLPENLLSTRSFVFHSADLTNNELTEAQGYFQKAGIDAVAYFPIDMLTAGTDVKRAFFDLLTKRDVANIIFLEKSEKLRIVITTFNGKENVFDAKQNAWSVTNIVWTEALKILYRSASTQLKKQNLLINTAPEFDITPRIILGKRNEFYAVDLKVDPLGVLKSGDASFDQELEALLTANFPFKFKMFEPGTSEKDMRKQGFYYTLLFVHARGSVVRDLMEYNATKAESAIVSVTYPDGQPQQLKNIPAATPIFKVYFKHIDSQNVFLGGKWDADLTWQQALLNNIRGLKTEMRIN